jgi:hypothetical protein
MEEEINKTEQPKKTFFGKVKDFFTKAKANGEEDLTQVSSAPIPTQAQALPVNRVVRYEECFWCKAEIFEDEKYSNQQGRHFHRVCYKKFLQAGRRNKI